MSNSAHTKTLLGIEKPSSNHLLQGAFSYLIFKRRIHSFALFVNEVHARRRAGSDVCELQKRNYTL